MVGLGSTNMVYPGAEYTPNTGSCSLTLTNVSNTNPASWRAMSTGTAMLTCWPSTLDSSCSLPSFFTPAHKQQNAERLNRSQLRGYLRQHLSRMMPRAVVPAVRACAQLDCELLSVPNSRHRSAREHVIVSCMWSQAVPDRAAQRCDKAGGSIRR